MIRYRTLTARRTDTCTGCDRTTEAGETIRYGGPGLIYCSTCEPDPDAVPTSTTRERREARANRLRGWADSREAKSDAALAKARDMASMIPFGQPMMPGHHSYRADVSYRDRMHSAYDRGMGDAVKADEMHQRAANIEAATAGSIFDDDPDAIERLEAKLARLEAERDRIKAYNASCRKGAPDLSLLTERERDGLRLSPAAYQERRRGQMPSYVLSNLGGTIAATRKRLEALR